MRTVPIVRIPGGRGSKKRTTNPSIVKALRNAVAVTALLFAMGSAAQSTKPNIVYIVADDLGWKDVGFHGSDIRTPAIDQLARTGARLEQFYAQPMCTPTRAALMRCPRKKAPSTRKTEAFPDQPQYGGLI